MIVKPSYIIQITCWEVYGNSLYTFTIVLNRISLSTTLQIAYMQHINTWNKNIGTQ